MNHVLDAILDTLIPPSEDGRMPGAGSLGLAETEVEEGHFALPGCFRQFGDARDLFSEKLDQRFVLR